MSSPEELDHLFGQMLAEVHKYFVHLKLVILEGKFYGCFFSEYNLKKTSRHDRARFSCILEN